MSGARDQILAAVRNGLLRADLPDAHRTPRHADHDNGGTPAARRARFVAALTALTGRVHDAAGLADAAAVISAIAAEHGARSFVSWDDDQLGCPGLLAALAARGLARVPYDLPFDQAGRAADVPPLGEVVLGLTGSHAAIADGGAIVLASGPGRGRLASLLPPVHVALVSASRIWPSLPQLLADEPSLVTMGANLVVVAGPSRTADIEMTLTHGVHGPKHLHVVLIP